MISHFWKHTACRRQKGWVNSRVGIAMQGGTSYRGGNCWAFPPKSNTMNWASISHIPSCKSKTCPCLCWDGRGKKKWLWFFISQQIWTQERLTIDKRGGGPKRGTAEGITLLHSPARTNWSAITREKLQFWLRISATLRSPAVPKGTRSLTVPQRSCL